MGTLHAIRKSTRRRLDELRRSIERLEEQAPPVLTLIAGELARLTDAMGDASYRPDPTRPQTPLEFIYYGGEIKGREHWYPEFLRRTQDPWPVFAPAWIEPSQRNIVVSFEDIARLKGTAAIEENPYYYELYQRIGIVQTLRALVTDGPVLLAWVGIVSPDQTPFRDEQTLLLQSLVPTLQARLRTERLLSDQRLTLTAFAPLLEAISAPALLVDARAHIHHANEAGVAWLDDDHVAARAVLRAALQGKAPDVEVTPLAATGMAPRWLVVVRRHRQLSAARVQQAAARWRLTPRQSQVLALLVEGQANKTIAARLGIEENTAEVHVSAILRKAQVDSRASLIAALLREA